MTEDLDGPTGGTDVAVVAGIAYHGVSGSSYDCLDAVKAIVQSRMAIPKVRILTAGSDHALLLLTAIGDPIAIKSGFASGYGGAGPHALSMALQLLNLSGSEIDEIRVGGALIMRLDQSELTQSELDGLTAAPPIRPSRWNDYVSDDHFERGRDGRLFREMQPVMPFGILDHRLVDLALTFWEDSDARLTVGYRRLEDTLRARTGLKTSSTKLMNDAFGDKGKLVWALDDQSERVGRCQLFTGAFMAFRNPRAHRVPAAREALSEFLLLNQLFLLEAESMPAEEADVAR